MKFVGLDIEATGSDYRKYQLIQIGVATLTDGNFVADVGWDTYEFEAEAMAVNGFSEERVRAGLPADEVDRGLVPFLEAFADGQKLIPVGWNVGSFDMQFVRKFLPLSSELFSYRSVDLNAVVFTMNRADLGGFDGLKKRSKKYAEATIPNAQWHDALYDARAALASWEYLTGVMGGM